VITAGLTAGQERSEDQRLTEELYELVDKRTDLIKRSIARSTNEWAGTYAAGDHHPTVFIWTPDAGFLVTSSHHTFSPSWLNYGEVSITGSLLSLRPVLPRENRYAHRIATEFRMVKWGEQHFLIPPDELKKFAYAVHSRAESEIVHYFFRWEDRDKRRRGLPNLPLEFTKYLKMPPIVTRIVAVDRHHSTALLSVGRRNNVIEGMVFFFASRRGMQFSVRVTNVSETESEGRVDSGHGEIREGLRLTSRIPKGFIEPG
jgi:hypothetical protein